MTLSDASILVTGGAGFIGSRLCAALAAEGARVTAFDNFHPQAHAGNPGARERLDAAGATLVEGDVRDAAALRAALSDAAPDIVYHLAAETGTGQSFDLPVRYTDVNVMGTAHLVEAIRALPKAPARVILAGSRSVYGEGACVDDLGHPAAAVERADADMAAGDYAPKDAAGRPLTPVATRADTCPVAPASVYASTKLMQEYLLSQAFWGSDTQVGILRLQNVYGPGQSLNNPYTGVLSIFVRQIGEGKTLEIYEDGEIVRDFVLVDDVVEAFATMARAGDMPRRVIDVGAGEGAAIHDVARRLLRLMSADADRTRVTGAFRPGDIRHAVADIGPARDLLGWQPRHDLDEGLSRLVSWSAELG